ncbi:23S rRNA (pseudouridine(1915)-N(3))-methyltransferase RlmH [Candidatus Saccharibacteria bacterium]|nr:23S rRNA (pseudouridine(1915)-N(3))-methyltransferase RlmH [Candidatus Saccharibacteria bacterium]
MRVITVGKKQEKFVAEGVAEYEKRLRKPFDLDWLVLPDGDMATEEKAILRAVSEKRGRDFVILLDERGENLTSPELAALLAKKVQSQNIVFVIGGSFGVGEAVKARADYIWSLSRLVFPHQLVRLVLVEQVYRAQTIANGQSYHHA